MIKKKVVLTKTALGANVIFNMFSCDVASVM